MKPTPKSDIPFWVGGILVPGVNLAAATAVTGLLVLAIYWGAYQNGTLSLTSYLLTPLRAAEVLVSGSFGSLRNLSYTLFYTTNFIFAGLSVAIAAQCGLFNIGGEGQAYFAGLGVTVVCLKLAFLPGLIVVPIAILAAALFGAAWAFVPGYLQAWHGSHVVITTIMFNFIASSVMVYLIVHVFTAPGTLQPGSPHFASNATLWTLSGLIASFGGHFSKVPLNISFLLALVLAFLMWIFIWRTRWGYTIRTVGSNQRAAVYAGIRVESTIVWVMCLSGAMAGMIAVNEVMGSEQRLIINFVAGAGFVGVAVSLMGRNHPFGIIFASILFGALSQGGSELSFSMPEINKDLAVVIQGIIILFAGALENMLRKPIETRFRRKRVN